MPSIRHFAGLVGLACVLLPHAGAISEQGAPAVYAVIRQMPADYGALYNAPNGPDTPWPSGNFSVGNSSSGISVSSSFGASGGSLSMHLAHDNLGFWRSIAAVDVYVRGDVGTAFRVAWTCSQRVQATTVPNSGALFSAGITGPCGVHGVSTNAGTQSDVRTDSGSIEGGTSGSPVFNPAYPGVPYFLATGFVHWADVHGQTCVGCGTTGSGSVDFDVSFSASIVRPQQQSPTAVIAAPATASVNAPVVLDGSSSHDPDGTILEHRWSVDRPGGGNDVLLGPTLLHSWAEPGTFLVVLSVTDDDGQTGTASRSIVVVAATDSDGDGVADSVDQCPGTPPGAPVDPNGCSAAQRDSDGDGVTDDLDQCPNTPIGTPVNASGCPTNLTIITSSLPQLLAGAPYVAVLQAQGGTPPYTWSLGSGVGPLPYLPPNVAFDVKGLISSDPGTRLSAGLYNFALIVTDSASHMATARLDLVVSCGDSDRDSVSDEYVTFGAVDLTGILPTPPVCQDFTQSARSSLFEFFQLKSTASAWALIRLPLTTWPISDGLDKWVSLYQGPGGARIISSAYRTPARNFQVGGRQASRHIWGDAVDLNNNTGRKDEWDAMCLAAQSAGADFVECRDGDPIDHVHADWRAHAGAYQHGTGGQ